MERAFAIHHEVYENFVEHNVGSSVDELILFTNVDWHEYLLNVNFFSLL